MDSSSDSPVEKKFVPKVYPKCGKKCFDAVDKWCTRILTKTETGDDWNKIIRREIALLKVKYPFLSEKQIRGRALTKFGVPNSMGDIVRTAGKFTGPLAKELTNLSVKKEPRVPPPYKIIRRKVDKIKKEIKQTPSSTATVSPLRSPLSSEITENSMDENSNLTPKQSILRNPKKCLLKRFRLPTESEAEDESVQRKRARIEPTDLNEVDSKYYISQLLESQSSRDNGDDINASCKHESGTTANSMIYSQLSDSHRRYLTSFSDWVAQEETQTQAITRSQQSPPVCQNPPTLTSESTSPPNSPDVIEEFSNFTNSLYNDQNNEENRSKFFVKDPNHGVHDKLINPLFQISQSGQNNDDNGAALISYILRKISRNSSRSIFTLMNKQDREGSNIPIKPSVFAKERRGISKVDVYTIETNYPGKGNNFSIRANGFCIKEKNFPSTNTTYPDQEMNFPANQSLKSPIESSQILVDGNLLTQETLLELTPAQFASSTAISEKNSDEDLRVTQLIQDNFQASPKDLSIKRNTSNWKESPLPLSLAETQSVASVSPLPTDNSQENPWLNVTSQDFTQSDCVYYQDLTQDSGTATQNSVISQLSFMSLSSTSSPEVNTGTLQDLRRTKISKIKKTIENILLQLQSDEFGDK